MSSKSCCWHTKDIIQLSFLSKLIDNQIQKIKAFYQPTIQIKWWDLEGFYQSDHFEKKKLGLYTYTCTCMYNMFATKTK